MTHCLSDPDGDGILTRAEWMALMKEVRPDLDEEGHEFLLQIADKAGDGTIDVIDFLAVC